MNDLPTSVLKVGETEYSFYPVSKCEGSEKLPYSLTVLLENVLRNARSADEARKFAQRIIDAGLAGKAGDEVEFAPARVLFQDFTGVLFPCSSISRSCAMPAWRSGAIRQESIRRCLATLS